jgi:hypothetical protein
LVDRFALTRLTCYRYALVQVKHFSDFDQASALYP